MILGSILDGLGGLLFGSQGRTISGNDRDNTLDGTNRDDVIDGKGGNDTIRGRGGNDILIGGTGDDDIMGGSGDDVVFVNVTTDGADTVDLNTGADAVLVSANAPTQVRLTFTSSEVGNGAVNDSNSLANQDGGLAVRLQAEDGAGALTGPVSRYEDEGIAFISDAPGVTFDVRDLVSGAQRGDQFQVVILGSNGGDVLGAEAADTRAHYINAGMADDLLTGGAGQDFLVGGAGADVLNGGANNDSYIGGGGNDVIADTGGGVDTVVAFNITTDGADSVDLGGELDVFNVSATAPTNVRVTFTSAEIGNGNALDGNNNPNEDGGLAVRIQAEDVAGALPAGGSVTRAEDEGLILVGGSGVTFDVRDLPSGVGRGEAFEVVVLGTSAADTLTAVQNARPYYFNGGMGDDTITGGLAQDFLVGGAGADVLNGGANNDSYIGGGGNDTIADAGGGVDTIAAFNITTDGADSVDLGGELDVFNVGATAPTNVRVTFTSAEIGNGNALDGNNNPNEDGGLAVRIQAEDVAGALPAGGNVTRAEDEGLILVGGAGVTFDVRDLPSGVGRGEAFEVVVLGTSAADTLTAVQNARPYYFNGGMGDDTITGGLAQDFLVGGAGADVLNGGANNDSYIGGGGDDLINDAGGGDDIAIFNVSTDGADRVNLGAGLDTVRVATTAVAPSQVRLTFTSGDVGNGAAFDGGNAANEDGGLSVRLQAEDAGGALAGSQSRFDDEGVTFVATSVGQTFEVVDLPTGLSRGDQFRTVTLGTAASDTLNGTAEADYINAGAGNNVVDAGAGADFLVGGSGHETLIGGDGNDRINGGAGNDVIRGGLGVDILTGSSGNDIFRFLFVAETGVTRATRDVITDFQQGSDVIALTSIDAVTALSGNQAFNFIGAAAFSGVAGELQSTQIAGSPNITLVQGDINGDGVGDFSIELRGLYTLNATDFVL